MPTRNYEYKIVMVEVPQRLILDAKRLVVMKQEDLATEAV